jgi:predicted Zn-dependent protease
MSNAYQLMEVSEPSEIALRDAIRSFTDEETEKPAEAMLADFLVILGRACARLDEGATMEEAIADLVFHGLERESAETIVRKAQEKVERVEAQRGQGNTPATGNWLTRFGILVIVLLGVLVYMYAAR